MKKSEFHEFVNDKKITGFDAKIRLALKDGSCHEAVWVTWLPDLDPSVDGVFPGFIGDEQQVFFLLDENRYMVLPVSQVESLQLLQPGYLAPTDRDFLHRLRMEVEAMSNNGRVRESNEDHILLLDNVFTNDHLKMEVREEPVSVFAVADGMSGHPYGDVASREVLQHLAAFVKALPAQMSSLKLDSSLKKWGSNAHKHLVALGKKNPEYKGMGTTVCGLLVHNGRLLRFHAGDSRLYQLRNNDILLLTRDHSTLAGIGPAWAENHLTNCLGACKDAFVEIGLIEDVRPNDSFLLCTDGLSNLIKDKDICHYMKKNGLAKLVNEVIRSGGTDNVSVISVVLNDDGI